MSTQERDPIASGGSSPPEDSENSRAYSDKGKGSRRQTRQTVIMRSDLKHATTHSQDDSMDDFGKTRTCAKKITTSKASKKGGGRKNEGIVNMAISKAQGAKKVS
jgi:hypothetical protein